MSEPLTPVPSEADLEAMIRSVGLPNVDEAGNPTDRVAFDIVADRSGGTPTWQTALRIDIGDAATEDERRFDLDFSLITASESNFESYLVLTLWLTHGLPLSTAGNGDFLGVVNDLNREPGLKFRVDVPLDSDLRPEPGGEIWLVAEAELPAIKLSVEALRQALDRLIIYTELKGRTLIDFAIGGR